MCDSLVMTIRKFCNSAQQELPICTVWHLHSGSCVTAVGNANKQTLSMLTSEKHRHHKKHTTESSASRAFSASRYRPSFMQHKANIYRLCAEVHPATGEAQFLRKWHDAYPQEFWKYRSHTSQNLVRWIGFVTPKIAHAKQVSVALHRAKVQPKAQITIVKLTYDHDHTSLGNSAFKRSAMNLALSIMCIAKESTTCATS